MMSSEQFDRALSQAIAGRRIPRRSPSPSQPVAAATSQTATTQPLNPIVANGMIAAASMSRRPGAMAHCIEVGAKNTANPVDVAAARRRLMDGGDHKALFSLGMMYIFQKFGAAQGHAADKFAAFDAVRRSCALGRVPTLSGIEVKG